MYVREHYTPADAEDDEFDVKPQEYPLTIPKKLCGNYTVIKPLGGGTYGNVFEVRDARGRRGAIKQYVHTDTEDGINPSALRELDILSRMHHPNIIRVLDVSVSKRHEICLIMERADMNLHEYIAKYRGTPRYDPLELFAHVACGVAELHANHIIHGDLKPANCLVKDGIVKIADLDCIINPLDRKQPPDGNITTLWWRAPEIFDRNPYNEAIDIWALGLILYELYTGDNLVSAGDEVGVHFLIDYRIKQMGARIKKMSLRELRKMHIFKGMPPEIIKFMYSMLEIESEDRPTIREIFTHPIMTKYRCRINNRVFYEKYTEFSVDFNDKRSIAYRKMTIDWIRGLQLFHRYNRDVLYTAIDIFDRVYNPYDKTTIQLYAAAAFLIATKLVSDNPFTLAEAAKMTSSAYTPEEILAAEYDICRRLKFRLYRTNIHDLYPKKHAQIYEMISNMRSNYILYYKYLLDKQE